MVADFVAAVDSFVPLQKTLVGAEMEPDWKRGRELNERKLLLPIEVDGEQRGQSLMVLAYPNNPTLMFKVGIQFLGHVVCRLDFEFEAVHANNFQSVGDGLPRLVVGPHWHKWVINKGYILSSGLPFKLRNAVPFDNHPRFDAALRAFCAEWNIELGHHAIELPHRDALL